MAYSDTVTREQVVEALAKHSGKRGKTRRFTAEECDKLRLRVVDGATLEELADEYNVNKFTLRNALLGRGAYADTFDDE